MRLSQLTLVPLIVSASAALADWTLTSDSAVTFQSTKNTHKLETHYFEKLAGSVKADGSASLSIDLSSVKTGIPIRDQRMQEYLFEVSQFASATFDSQLPKAVMKGLTSGKTQIFDLAGTISLHGMTEQVTVPVIAVPAKDGSVVVSSLRPLNLGANKFGLSAGIDKLKEIAGLNSIGYLVPVSFSLVFEE